MDRDAVLAVSLVAAAIMPGDSASSGRAAALSETFWMEVTPTAWREFKDHFTLLKEANIARGVSIGQDASCRSLELRLCLVGAPAVLIREKVAQKVTWVNDDDLVLDHLEKRYVTLEAIEVRIIRLEEEV